MILALLARVITMDKRDSTSIADPEKAREESTSSFDLGDKDEALRLVGLERSETFTEEQYRRVRRKLVGIPYDSLVSTLYELSLHLVGLGDPSAMPGSVLLTIPVSLLFVAQDETTRADHDSAIRTC